MRCLTKYILLISVMVISVSISCANTNVPQYRFTTFAGLGQRGFRDGKGREALFERLGGIAVDSEGNIFVVDIGNRCIRKITSEGEVSLFAGKPGKGVGEIIDGSIDEATFHSPQDIAVDVEGNFYVTERAIGVVRKITAEGVVKTIAGKPGERDHVDGPLSEARFSTLQGIAVDSNGNVYVTDWSKHTIRKITPDGEVRTIAGSPGERGHVDGPSDVAKLDSPYGICVSSDIYVYFTERRTNGTIRKIDPDGRVSTVVSYPDPGRDNRLSGPVGIAIDNHDNLFIANRARQNIIKADTEGNAEVLAGRYRGDLGRRLFMGRIGRDGDRARALFAEPRWIAVSDDGILYIVDTGENLIRKGEPVR